MDWPDPRLIRPRMIVAGQDWKATSIALSSGAWLVANTAYFYPVRLRHPFILRRFFLAPGGTAANNFDIGLYSADGTRLYSTGSTAQSGTTDCQTVDVTDVVIPPGWYYLALAFNGTSGTTMRTTSYAAIKLRQFGVCKQASAFPLPATLTPAAMDQAVLPLFGLMREDAL